MKILHVLDHSFPENDGYAFRTGEIVRFQRELGWETLHVTSSKQPGDACGCEQADGLEFYRTAPGQGFLDRLPILDQWAVVKTLKKRLDEIIPEHKPDILHAHSPALPGIAALAASRKYQIPMVYEVRTFWEDAAVDKGACREGDLRYRITRGLDTHVVSGASATVAICEGLRNDLLGRGIPDSRISVVPNSVDIERFTASDAYDESMANELGLSRGKTLGFIGSFFKFEGLEVLVRAMPEILAKDPQARLVMVGGGVEDANLKELVNSLGIQSQVLFTGRVPHSEVGRYYELIDILVYPRVSMRITELVTPLKPLEAMAKRKLVVASDVGGHREMVSHNDTGLLFKAGEPQALAGAVLEFFSRTADWEGFRERGVKYVASKRNWRENIRLYEDVYEKIIGQSN